MRVGGVNGGRTFGGEREKCGGEEETAVAKGQDSV